MNLQSCTRRIQFCAGHRVLGHEGKCANMHGHNYVLFVTAIPEDDLDSVGRVIDFSTLKEKLGGWIDTNWDHGFLYYNLDDNIRRIINAFDEHEPVIRKRYPCEFNPTAENMAYFLLMLCNDVLFADDNIIVTEIILWETENCYAKVSL